ncbi:MAG: lipid-A-disaccharide synthase [Bacteroidia bacterium]
MPNPKLYIIAGEDSGDLHAANLVKALRHSSPNLEIRGVGGDQMQSQAVDLIAHVRDINFMGFIEVVRNLKTIRGLFKKVKADIDAFQPEAIVLVDYPGFNIRLLPFLRERGIKIIWYISPQVWAWKKGRVKTLRQYVDRMMVILPFEQEFYQKEGMEVDFVGHPLLDAMPQLSVPRSDKKTIALLPGSRKQEITRMLPLMLEMQPRFPDYHFVIAGAPSQTADFYQRLIGERSVELRMNQTYDLLQAADFALVTSGTATLETALFATPQVVCYKASPISYAIGKRLVKIRFISLVNLILDRELVTELIQHDFNPTRLEDELRALMGEKRANELEAGYQELRERLGDGGASERAAEIVRVFL